MENDNTERIDSINDTEVTENTNNEVQNDQEQDYDEPQEDVEELKKKIKTLEFKRLHDKKKIEDLEKGFSKNIKTESKSNNSGLSPFDLMAVAKADLDEEGLEEVMEYASFKKLSVAEALKTSTIKAILAEKAENRKVAEATNTGVSRRGNSRVSEDILLDAARGGKYPDSDLDLKRLIEARMKKR